MRNVQGRCEDTAGVRDFGTSERACALTGVVHNATMVDREDVVQNTGDEARSAMIDLEGVVQNASDVAVCAREIAQRERERERRWEHRRLRAPARAAAEARRLRPAPYGIYPHSGCMWRANMR